MKKYEEQLEGALDPAKYWLARLDGSCFSTFTRAFVKPFDVRISEAMVNTLLDMVSKFNPCIGFTFSDEITLVFPPCPAADLIYSGRILKVSTVMASYCSVRFNKHLRETSFDESAEKEALHRANGGMAIFDARVFNVPRAEDVVDNLLWRQRYDCRRNSVSLLAQSYYSAKRLHGCSTETALGLLLAKGIRWSEQPAHFRFGTFAKKEKYEIVGKDPRTNSEVRTSRSRVATRELELAEVGDGDFARQISLITAKYWNDVEPATYCNGPGTKRVKAG